MGTSHNTSHSNPNNQTHFHKQPTQWRPSRTPPTTSLRPFRVPELRHPRRPTRALPRTLTYQSHPALLLERTPLETRWTRAPTTPRLMCTRRLPSTKCLIPIRISKGHLSYFDRF